MASPAESSSSRPHSPQLRVDVPSSSKLPDDIAYANEKYDPAFLAPDHAPLSPSESREAANRLNDDLELLRAERIVSNEEHSRRSRSRNRRNEPVEDAFQTNTSAAPVVAATHKKTFLTWIWGKLKKFPRFLRYIVYAIPPAILILAPIFISVFAYTEPKPVGGDGGVELLWFGIWLEVVWLTLWVSKILTTIMPPTFSVVAKAVGSSNNKKWKDIGRTLEFPTALFLWMLAVLVSYSPILNDHRVSSDPNGNIPDMYWLDVVYKIVIAFFVLFTLNFVEKILIQWIATSFHLRTYSHRIQENKVHQDFLVALYSYARSNLEEKDPVWDSAGQGLSSGARTPLKAFQNNARQALSKVGDAAARMAGDFTGRKILKGNHPRKVVNELLRNSASSQTLAWRDNTVAACSYRCFVKDGRDTIVNEDVHPAFSSPEEAEVCFSVFDKDLNGDVTMEELELVCNEIHLEKKAIAASLKDLDSVIEKLDKVFVFIIFVIVIIVFVSILSNSAAAALTSTGTVILGLSWLLQATAQEFLQSIIFVFVKHPFDVGDRVTVYGNVGTLMRGDDYYVKEISLLYTEFKKMEGHVVQAPNYLLNTLFILNQRRSQGLANPVELVLRFGTSEMQIEELRQRMLAFVARNKRDYAADIITEVRAINEVYSITVNFVFFHKSSFQNELLRLQRHNKFCVELMHQIKDLGIEGPRMGAPGGLRDIPIYLSNVQPPAYDNQPPNSGPMPPSMQPPSPLTLGGGGSPAQPRRRADSRAAVTTAPDFQDVYNGRRGDTQNAVTRLASIRQASRERSSSRSNKTGAGLDRIQSMESRTSESRRRIWNRPRGRSNAAAPPGGSIV
ncbi:hypothetical protein GQ53DRAFT_749851 [Thozetella sp. PMI_491]|nr:hypothetical protein GQ53DRAFT_749851 [Thozetella sp. PMI_491]